MGSKFLSGGRCLFPGVLKRAPTVAGIFGTPRMVTKGPAGIVYKFILKLLWSQIRRNFSTETKIHAHKDHIKLMSNIHAVFLTFNYRF